MQTNNIQTIDYRARYRSPAEVLADRTLSGDDKLAVLREWRLDALRRVESTGEGMPGEKPALREVDRAIAILEELPV